MASYNPPTVSTVIVLRRGVTAWPAAYAPPATTLTLGEHVRGCLVTWGTDAPYCAVVDVLTVGSVTATCRLLEANGSDGVAIEQEVTVPVGVANRGEPTFWRAGWVTAGSLAYR